MKNEPTALEEYLTQRVTALEKECLRLNDELRYSNQTLSIIERESSSRQLNSIASDPNFLKPFSELETEYKD